MAVPTLRLLRQRRHARSRRRRTIDARRVRARITDPTTSSSTGAVLMMIVIMTMVMMIPQHRMQRGQVRRTLVQRGSRGIRRVRVRVRAARTRILRRPEMRRIHGPHEPPMFSKKKKRFNKRRGRMEGCRCNAPLCRVQVLLAVHHPFLVRFERDDVAASCTTTTAAAARILAG